MIARQVLIVLLLVLTLSCTTILRTREEVRVCDMTIAITLDDGPSETEFVDDAILDVLKTRNIKAGFCLLTYKLAGNGRILKRIIEEGHTIAFHSRNHEAYLTKTLAQFLTDLKEFESSIQTESGLNYKVTSFRPPVGVLSLPLLRQIEGAGIKVLYATHNPTDTFVGSDSSSDYIERVIREFESNRGGILVLHNGSELFPRPSASDFSNRRSAANRTWVPMALDHLIETLSGKGFRFVNVDEISF